MDALVTVDRAVDGRLSSCSELDSNPPNGDSHQSGNCSGDIIKGEMTGAGVLGGEKALIEPRAKSETSIWSKLLVTDTLLLYIMLVSSPDVGGSSMLGIGQSAAATDSRNCFVGAVFV